MTKTKKLFVTLMIAFSFLCGGIVGVLMTNAETRNDLAVRYQYGKQTTAFLGESVKTAKATPIYPDKVKFVSYMVETPDGKTLSVKNESFTPETTGDYTVFVCVQGNDASTYVESYVVSVTKSAKPIMTQAPVLPAAFIEGFAYDAPVAHFTDYNETTPKDTEYTVYYISENGVETEVKEDFSPTVSLHGDKISLKYTATSSVTGETQSKFFDVPVLKAIEEDTYGDKLYNYQNMFVCEGVSSSDLSQSGSIFYGSNDFKVTYANLLKADGCSLGLTSLEGMANFGSLRITITDAVNKSEYVTLDISAIDENSSKLVINSATEKTVNGSVENLATGFWFTFENDTLKLFDTSYKLVATVSTTGNGDSFSGFSSNKVIVSVEAKALTAKSALVIYEVNGQPFNIDYRYDTIKPSIITEKEMPIRYVVGETITVSKAYAIDIIDPTVQVTVSVIDKETFMPIQAIDGTILKDVSAEKEYAFISEKTGSYTVEYYSKDVNDRYTDIPSYSLLVRDEQAPIVNVASPIAAAVSIGESITIPDFTYTDDYSSAEEMKTLVTVSVADGNYETVKAGDTFTFKAVGMYHIRFTVIDAYFNMTTVEYVVECR